MDGDHVRHAGADAKTLQDRSLGRLAVATIGRVESEHAGHSAQPQVLEDGTLDLGFSCDGSAPRLRHDGNIHAVTRACRTETDYQSAPQGVGRLPRPRKPPAFSGGMLFWLSVAPGAEPRSRFGAP